MSWAGCIHRTMRSPWRRLRRLGRVLQQRDVWMKTDVSLPTVRLGTDYGGWTFWPEPLDRNSVIYSFGVGEDISFDLALIARFGCAVHAFDPTPRSRAWILRQQTPAPFVFHEYGLGDVDGMLRFVPPANPAHVSYAAVRAGLPEASGVGAESFPVKRLETIVRKLGHPRVDLLKMDIEGAEYAALEDLLRSNLCIDQILVEFHHRVSRVDVARTRQAIAGLRAHGYRIFDVSPTGEEYAFVREPESIRARKHAERAAHPKHEYCANS